LLIALYRNNEQCQYVHLGSAHNGQALVIESQTQDTVLPVLRVLVSTSLQRQYSVRSGQILGKPQSDFLFGYAVALLIRLIQQ